MSFVQPPGLVNRNVSLFNDLQDRVECDLSASQDRGVSDVKLVVVILQGMTSILGLCQALLAQVGVEPAAEPVLLVPLGLSVPDHDNLVCGHVVAVKQRAEKSETCWVEQMATNDDNVLETTSLVALRTTDTTRISSSKREAVWYNYSLDNDSFICPTPSLEMFS